MSFSFEINFKSYLGRFSYFYIIDLFYEYDTYEFFFIFLYILVLDLL